MSLVFSLHSITRSSAGPLRSVSEDAWTSRSNKQHAGSVRTAVGSSVSRGGVGGPSGIGGACVGGGRGPSSPSPRGGNGDGRPGAQIRGGAHWTIGPDCHCGSPGVSSHAGACGGASAGCAGRDGDGRAGCGGVAGTRDGGGGCTPTDCDCGSGSGGGAGHTGACDCRSSGSRDGGSSGNHPRTREGASGRAGRGRSGAP
mmetsp:Transcript_2475/g.5174  ORF Transcript_2475/g.5174 Transcript_2475/m.5174 type:complete len:200 (-) Transcript_2475:15-614(-)